MRYLRACIMAFSTYSAIPVPNIRYRKDDDRFVFMFLPLVGTVLAGILFAWLCVAYRFFGPVFRSVSTVVLPVVFSGGIHMDGFLDSVDAWASLKSREEKLRILKDVHVGAFAIIKGVLYFLLFVGIVTEADRRIALPLSCGFVLSRCFTVAALSFMKNARGDGMLFMLQHHMHRLSAVISAAVFALFALAAAVWRAWLPSIAAFATVSLIFVLFCRSAKKHFGGITGDLAGFLIQITEIGWAFSLVLADRLISAVLAVC